MVVAHNPGLANPEISKIIGEQWRSLSEDDKSKWRALAEVSYIDILPYYRCNPDNYHRKKKLVISSSIPTTDISLGGMVGMAVHVQAQVSVTTHRVHQLVTDVVVD
jgi:hypothetical protein